MKKYLIKHKQSGFFFSWFFDDAWLRVEQSRADKYPEESMAKAAILDLIDDGEIESADDVEIVEVML